MNRRPQGFVARHSILAREIIIENPGLSRNEIADKLGMRGTRDSVSTIMTKVRKWLGNEWPGFLFEQQDGLIKRWYDSLYALENSIPAKRDNAVKPGPQWHPFQYGNYWTPDEKEAISQIRRVDSLMVARG